MNKNSVKIFMTKETNESPWGFGLQGGTDMGKPLSVFKVTPNTPSDGKLDPGDVITEIAGTPTENLTHDEALDIIRKCNNALFLNIEKCGRVKSRSSSVHEENTILTENVQSPISPISPQQSDLASRYSIGADAPIAPPLLDRASIVPKYKRPEKPKKVESPPKQIIPEKLIGTMSRPGLKPFTYTPHGIDLNAIREKAREKRQMQRQQEFQDPVLLRQKPKEVDNRVPRGFIRSSFRDTDVVTQSRSFQMLEGWINENAQNTPPAPSGAKSAVAQAIEDEESGLHRHQDTVPSRVFKKLQDYCEVPNLTGISRIQYDNARKNEAIKELYQKVPARDRDREPEAHKYQGSTIPSKSFKLLQQFSVDDSYNQIKPDIEEPDVKKQSSYSTVPSKAFRMLQRMSSGNEEESTGSNVPYQRRSVQYAPRQQKYKPAEFISEF